MHVDILMARLTDASLFCDTFFYWEKKIFILSYTCSLTLYKKRNSSDSFMRKATKHQLKFKKTFQYPLLFFAVGVSKLPQSSILAPHIKSALNWKTELR